MTTAVVAIFVLVYLGMILGGLPFLRLDRTGVALLGAIAVVSAGALSPEAAAQSVHLPTLILLFAFMVISAQMRLGGFYDWVTRRVAELPLSPPGLLAALIGVIAVLAAIFSNDVVCLAVAPVLIDACLRRGLNPLPFLLALACAANIGSAATLIGNPQNMLIGSMLRLGFADYLWQALPVVVPGLAVIWAVLVRQSRGRWTLRQAPLAAPITPHRREDDAPLFDRWQSAKGLAVAGTLVLVFLFEPVPREVAALAGAGVLLMSIRLHSTRMLGLVDWGLLVLFIGLFVVNHALQQTGIPARLVESLADMGWHLEDPALLFGATFVLSNIVSNVPAVMLLLPMMTHELAGPMAALVSTLAGNLLIVGSIANIIVVDLAAQRGIQIDWRTHARTGIPVTLLSVAISAIWFAWRLKAF